VAVLPLVNGLLLFLLRPQPLFRPGAGGTTELTHPLALLGGPLYLVVMAAGWVIAAAIVVCSWLDYRELGRRGVERPFHWAWSFLGVVYPIGRSIIVRGVSGGRGLGALWVAVAAYVVSVGLAVVWSVLLVAQIIGTAIRNVPPGA
jgi:hypothetical protein